MKRFSKLTALLCCVALLVCCVSCANTGGSDVPEGMKLASAAGADFRLYVPSVWNVNTAYGVSGAYYKLAQQSTVSMVKYAITETMETAMTEAEIANGGDRLDWFWETECKSAVEDMALGGSLNEITDGRENIVLDGVNAHKFHIKANVNGETLHFVHVVAEKDTAFYVFTYTAEEALYAALLENVTRMLDEFIFAEPYLPDDYIKDLDADVTPPTGMKLASNNDVAYRFFVPTDWEINRDEEIFSAYRADDRSSVSVVPYMPDVDSMSVAQYFELCEKSMQNFSGEDGYELIKTEKEIDLGGRVATAYTYRFTVGDTEYRYLQVVAAYKSMIYSLTYTALPEHFDTHLEDVQTMIDAFEFR